MDQLRRGKASAQASARVRRIVATLGILMIVAGLVLGFGAGRLRIDPDTARIVSSVLILGGIVDLVTAMVWDKLFGSKR